MADVENMQPLLKFVCLCKFNKICCLGDDN
jgi:hypothetical protein